MIGVTILYPKSAESTFDVDYYTDTHMPLFVGFLGEACKGWGVIEAKGPQYHAVGWAMVDSEEAFNSAMAAHGAEIMADVPNYTSTKPVVVVGEVKR